jgi:hypothetical protein
MFLDKNKKIDNVQKYIMCTNVPSSQTFFPDLLLPLWSMGLISQFLDHFTDGRTPWTGDQLVARPLPEHRTTQTQNKHIRTRNINALCGIRIHDPVFRAREDSTCLTPLGYRDRLHKLLGLT